MKEQTEQKIREYIESFRIQFTGEEKPGSVSTLSELVMYGDSSDPVSEEILTNICNIIEKDGCNVEKIEEIKQMIAKFSDEKFGVNRPFTAPLHHLKKEVDEAIESGEIEEFVDMLLLLIDAYRKRFPDFPVQTLLNCCEEKIINILPNRQWAKADENGVIEHIRNSMPAEFTERQQILDKAINSFPEGDRFVTDSKKIKYIREDIVLEAIRLNIK